MRKYDYVSAQGQSNCWIAPSSHINRGPKISRLSNVYRCIIHRSKYIQKKTIEWSIYSIHSSITWMMHLSTGGWRNLTVGNDNM